MEPEERIRQLIAELVQQRMTDTGESIQDALPAVVAEINKAIKDLDAVAVIIDGNPPCLYFTHLKAEAPQ